MANRIPLAAFFFLALAQFSAIVPASAQTTASRAGATFSIGASPTGARRPDVAFDSRSGVYLVIAQNEIYGRFVNADGVPLGPGLFKIGEGLAHTQSSRAAYSPDLGTAGGFLVTWLDTRTNGPQGSTEVWGRLLTYTASGVPAFLSPDFRISAATRGVHPEMAPAVAYSTTSKEFLVSWVQGGPISGPLNEIRAQRVALNGALLGCAVTGGFPPPCEALAAPLTNEIAITYDNHWSGEPAVGYNPTTNEFLVAHRHYNEPSGPAEIRGRRVTAGSGAVSDIVQFYVGGFASVPDVSVDNSGQWLVSWYAAVGNGVYYGQFLGTNGAKVGVPFPMVVNYSAYDGFDISFNPTSGTYLAVFHGRSDLENWAQQVSAAGAPDVEFQATASGTRVGSFNPRITAHGSRKEWLMVTADFAQVLAQRLQTTASGSGGGPGPVPPPPPPPPPPPTPIDLSTANAPNGSWFLAEGVATDSGYTFDTFYLLNNANNAPVEVRAYFAKENGASFERSYTLPAYSRKTLSLRQEMGAGAFGAVFQSKTAGLDITVERSVFWGTNLEGSTGEVATKQLSANWYFAEGSRTFEVFDNYFLLFNPNQSALQVTATFFKADGTSTARTFNVERQQRYTLSAKDLPELAGQDFSAQFTANGGIMVERSMYFGSGWMGGHSSVGAPNLSTAWAFAEGAAAPGFDTYFTVFNPHPSAVQMSTDYFTEAQGPKRFFYTLPPRARFTIKLNNEIGNIGGASSLFWTPNGEPILVERSVYWGAGAWVEGHNAVGSNTTANQWLLPEGSTAGSFETFLLLENPNPSAIGVRVSIYVDTPNGGRYTPIDPIALPGLSRKTIYMHDFLRDIEVAEGLAAGTLVGKSFGTRVVGVNAADRFVAEHAIYWRRDGVNYWRGGSAAFGIVVP